MAKNLFFSNSAQSRVNIDIKAYIFEFLISSATTLYWKFLTSLNRLHIIESIKWAIFWSPVCFHAL